MLEIAINKHIAPYFIIAENIAKASLCVRGQFGAVITGTNQPLPFYIARNNIRVSKCCDGGICARDLVNARHVERVEVGAEIHAELAALIDYEPGKYENAVMILVGYKGPRELLGTDAYPCHVCALALKYAGFKYVYIKDLDHTIVPVSISGVLEYRESEWASD